LKLIDTINHSEVVYLVPLGDIHAGSRFVDWKKLQGYIDWIAERPNAYSFIPGDLFDVSTVESPTTPYDQKMNLNQAIDYMTEVFKPIINKIIGAISGNHEERLEKYAGFNPLEEWCHRNNVFYAGYSAVLRFRIGKHIRTELNIVSPKIEYVLYVHHSVGGGATSGGKLNAIEKLTKIFIGADAYLGGHNHFEAEGKPAPYYLSKSGNGKASIQQLKQHLVDTGSFVLYEDNYPEMKALPPSATGAPRIRMNGIKKDLHISY